ncbi:Transport and Golgi organization protein 6-like [Hondaea fermentalgiana]|uniref:Transport and Golgi organization protein 6-like n=1 Tax=Hondaea fermentalgiana TaxID=2315210 RepID=A0A2R5G885_9STRA|nr:Transport and Golgi organization protein 6-like [Hondaea fermentalgiana]|eukprot:GBG26755.1 Transport and Golgi organization protein 6-like [Hondaea fermentalgiana]
MEDATAFVRSEAARGASADELRAHCERSLELLRAELAARREAEPMNNVDKTTGPTPPPSQVPKEAMVSVAQQVSVQVLLEILLCWTVYPYLALASDQGVFGLEPDPTVWSTGRDTPSSLKLDETIRNRGFAKYFSNRSLCEDTAQVLDAFCQTPMYAQFLQDRYLGDRCLIAVALGHPVLEEIRGTRLHVTGYLRALQLQAKYAQTLLTAGKSSPRQSALRGALGRRLSALVPKRGGVLAVMTTMLTNVPHGNIQAFQQVSGLLVQKPESRPAVAGQLVDLIRGSLQDTDKTRGALVRRSAVMTVNELARVDAGLASEQVLQPLVKALGQPSEETAILQALEFARILMAAAPPDPALLKILEVVLTPALEIMHFASIKNCRGEGEAQALVRLWLDHVDANAGVRLVRKFAAISGASGWYTEGKTRRLALRRSPSGGLVLLESLATSEDDASLLGHAPSISVSDGILPEHDDNEDVAYTEGLDPTSRAHLVLQVVGRHSRAAALQNGLFAQSLEGIARILDDQNQGDAELDPQVAADVALVQGLLEVQSTFALSRDHVDVESVARGIARLLRACAHALGLWRHEDAAYQETENRHAGSGGRAGFALEIAPVALAMAASLASGDANADLWPDVPRSKDISKTDAAPTSQFSRFRVLEEMLAPLSALGRMGEPDVVDQIIGQQQHQQRGQQRVDKNIVGSIDPLHAQENAQASVRALAGEIAELAGAVRVAILTTPTQRHGGDGESRWTPQNRRAEASDEVETIDPIGRRIAEADNDLRSKDPPVRAMGLDKLSAIMTGSLRPSEQHFEGIVNTLVATLQDDDSYVYLTCVRAIATASTRYPRDLFPKLVDLFVDENSVPITVRIRLGEALASAAKRAGEMLPAFAPRLIRAFCLGTSGRTAVASTQGSGHVDAQGRYVTSSAGTRRERPVAKPPAELADMYRTSCLSNLADLCALAPWAAFQFAQGAVALAKGVMTFDKSVSARRAAAYVLLKVVEGAAAVEGTQGLQEIPADLREAMRIINDTGDRDEDRVVRFHCDRARGVLDGLMRRFAFPDQQDKVLRVSLGIEEL